MSDSILTELCNIIYQENYYIDVASNKSSLKIYLILFRDIIQKYLNDPKNYRIYVSTIDKYLADYQTIWPDHERLIYVASGLLPEFPGNSNIIYFYHRNDKHNTEEELQLISYLESNPFKKFIYVTNANKMTFYTLIKLFRYRLRFDTTPKRWRCQIGKKYLSQKEKLKKLTRVTTYDYFMLQDMMTNKSKIFRFNKKIVIRKENTNHDSDHNSNNTSHESKT